MVGEIITNFELYVWIALGLFVVGIVAVLIYENGMTDSNLKRRKQQRQPETSSQSDDRRIYHNQ
jgi:heme exporter protein D